MNSHISKHRLISPNQHGFISDKSTITNLLKSYEIVAQNLENKETSDVLFLDLQKAFDKIDHFLLLNKFRKCGFPDFLVGFLESFLYDRFQRVVIRDSISVPALVLSGVPQGCITSPTLFNLFINDLYDVEVDSFIISYADDTKIISASSRHMQLAEDISKIVNWFLENRMFINIKKTKVMYFGKTNPKHPYEINGERIEAVDHIKDLGVFVDPELKFYKHCVEVTKKAYFVSNNMLRCFSKRRVSLLTALFKIYVRPILEYCSQFWFPSTRYQNDMIEKVQRRFSKRICGDKSLDYSSRCQCLRLESLSSRRLKLDLLLLYKVLNGSSSALQYMFKPNDHSITRGHSKKLYIPSRSTRFAHDFWSYRVLFYWNSLSPDIIQSKTFDEFKRKLMSIDLLH
jgi:hypothetical protein